MKLLYLVGSEFREVYFDATVKLAPTHTSTPTRSPVVSGVRVTDHVDTQPDTLACEVHVSNTPVRNPGVDGAQGFVESVKIDTTGRTLTKSATVSQSGNVQAAEYADTASTVSASVLKFGAEFDRVQAVYETLDRLRRDATIFTVETKHRVYDSMVISLLEAPRDASTGEGITFALNFEEVRLVSVQYVETPEPLETRAERTRAQGTTATAPAPAPQQSFARATLREYFPSLFGAP